MYYYVNEFFFFWFKINQLDLGTQLNSKFDAYSFIHIKIATPFEGYCLDMKWVDGMMINFLFRSILSGKYIATKMLRNFIGNN